MQDMFKLLKKAIKDHNQIILMAHKNIDLDALGSLLCLYEIITSFKKDTYIIINKRVNKWVKKAFRLLENINFKYDTKDINNDALLIIVDTNKKELLEQESLLDIVKNIIVIDHHIKNKDHIKNTSFSYVNVNLSSAAEILVYFAKYLNKNISKITATIMLAGIEIDTNNFSIKTTEKTHEAAAILLKMGADNVLKKELLKESKEDYLKRHNFIEKAILINKNVAVSLFDEGEYNKEDLAIVATELLEFEDIQMGFAIGKLKNKKIGISAKSLGENNVEILMKKLGGGGHLNNAATELTCKTINEAKEKLVELIEGKL